MDFINYIVSSAIFEFDLYVKLRKFNLFLTKPIKW